MLGRQKGPSPPAILNPRPAPLDRARMALRPSVPECRGRWLSKFSGEFALAAAASIVTACSSPPNPSFGTVGLATSRRSFPGVPAVPEPTTESVADDVSALLAPSLVAGPASTMPARPSPPAATTETSPAEAVQAVIQSHFDEVQRCFDRAQMDQPFLKVRVEMSASIAPDGRVSAVTISSSREGTSRLQACIREAVHQWRFMPPTRGEPEPIKYAFVFE